MKLFANPIFLTQRRLAHRAGIVAPVLIALLMGLSLLAGLIYDLHDKEQRRLPLQEESGRTFYAWLLVFQSLVLIVGGFSKISRTLVEERRAGLLDSNRLTPLKPRDLVAGYWLGAWTREVYLAVALAPVGLVMVLMAHLPVTLWLGTQVLLASSAMFFGLLAVLVGMAMRRPLGGVAALAFLPLLLVLTVRGQQLPLTSFLLPLHATMGLFHARVAGTAPRFFSLPVPSLMYTWGIQLLFGAFLWRGAVRKFADPFRPAFTWGQSVAVFGLMVLLQHGLVWGFHSEEWRHRSMLPPIHAGTILLGLIILGSHALKPERARIEALRMGAGRMRRALVHGGPCLALVLTVVAVAILFTQLANHGLLDCRRYLVAAANLATVYLSFALLLEICLISFRRRALGFFVLGLFVFYGLPFLLGAAFGSEAPMRFSFLTPGVVALATWNPEEVSSQIPASVAHVIIVAVLGYFWFTRWRGWLAQATTIRESSALPVR